jgi:ribosomal protein L37AE/L43A
MNLPSDKPTGETQWESVHICPRCGHILSLEDIDLKTITTGIVECPKCQWEGPIEIQVTDQNAGL